MSERPSCIGLYGSEPDCETCTFKEQCMDYTKKIESDVFRKGTHVRIVSKYKEKKYKPKKTP
ncbi:MAG: hypothetical protein ACETVR_03720 [Candidatus Bathyarchaeia archaeon]